MQLLRSTCALLAIAAASIASVAADDAANFTYEAHFPANIKVGKSAAYVIPHFDLSVLPKFTWSLANESLPFRESLCAQQVNFCQKAGCDAEAGAKAEDAKVDQAFCEPSNLGSRCTCSKGTSRLQQFEWPVHSQDCRLRGATCANQCRYGGGEIAKMDSCIANCDSVFGMNCGLEGQMSASYAVARQGDSPSLTMVQGGAAQIGAASGLISAPTAFAVSIALAAIAGSSLL